MDDQRGGKGRCICQNTISSKIVYVVVGREREREREREVCPDSIENWCLKVCYFICFSYALFRLKIEGTDRQTDREREREEQGKEMVFLGFFIIQYMVLLGFFTIHMV